MSADLTQTVSDAELAELLDQEIPCGGLLYGELRRKCTKPAVVRWSNPHGHTVPSPGAVNPYKCMDCWMVLYQHLADVLARVGRLRCASCGHVSGHVLEHTDFRPF